MPSIDDLTALRGKPVYASDGDRIGKLEDVYQDVATRQPEWIGVDTGFFGAKHVLVPVEGAHIDSDAIRLPYPKDRIKDAPDIDQDEISEEIERRLCQHYGIPYSHEFSSTGLPEGPMPSGYGTQERQQLRDSGDVAAGPSGYESLHARYPGGRPQGDGTTATGQPHHGGMPIMDEEMRRCIQDCLDCHRTCVETVDYCLETGGRHAEAGHIRLLLDCADICAGSADFMLRRSDLHGRTCAFCADICQRCAEDCDRFGDDRQMQLCAQACRRCAESCRQMADSMGVSLNAARG